MSIPIRTVGVVGTGVIGSSWITLFLAKGLKVIVSDPSPGASDKLGDFIRQNWDDMQSQGLADGAGPQNFRFVEDVAEYLSEVDFVQENAPEKPELKTKLFAQLDAKAPPDVILASSSSGIPSSQFIGGCQKAPGRVLIGHPFNPPHLIPLVEVVPHPKTDDSVTKRAMDFYKSLGKAPIWVKHECAGFVANRLQAAIAMESYSLVARGVVSASDLDAAVTTGLGLRWPMTGPYMTNVLGGGGGKDGFSHFLQHLGPSIQEWTRDMDKHKFDFSQKNVDSLNESVSEMIKDLDMEKMVKERDSVLLSLKKLKSQSSTLV